jgi:transcriptional regulator with XRE-family HTH domain
LKRRPQRGRRGRQTHPKLPPAAVSTVIAVEPETLQPELGERLREIRRQRGLRLADVSEATGISSSFLSLVESGKNDVTISRLSRLCRFYGLSIVDVLPRSANADAAVLRRDEHPHFFSPDEGIDVYLLVPDTDRSMMPVSMAFRPGGGLAEFSDYPGETFLAVVEGRIEVRIDEDEPVVLEEGDTVYLKAGRRYAFRNPDHERAARTLAVVSPPLSQVASERA